jgi:sugar phosphate isomerase/epimerase
MSNTSIIDRLAVCSWSLQPTSADDLFAKLAQTGLNRVQIALDPIREDAGGGWTDFVSRANGMGVTCVSGMFVTAGEDYSTLESIRETGGVVPDSTWEENWENIQANADLANVMGLEFVSFHAGFLPHEESDPGFVKLKDRITQIATLFAERDITLGFETGQETADTLALFLEKLACPNVGVNFDPANMLLYAKGDPIDALRRLAPWLRQVHFKDAVQTKVPGTWGEEVVLGTGQVDWPAFLAALNELGYAGDCCIEREAGEQRVADIIAGRQFVEKLTG